MDELSMTAHEGDIYGFIGKNGAGKSTALKMLCSLAAPTSGEIAIFGRPVTDSVSRKRTGILIESPGIYPGLGAEDNMMQKAVCLEKRKEASGDRRKRCAGFFPTCCRMRCVTEAGGWKLKDRETGSRLPIP
ncbi:MULTISPECIES: ATP-binding cassette domain-containing protein [Eisenbergiella]|nr:MULTISPECIES: ATP-binding cassette domain-containing protein [Eisenbergiella]MCI6706754.1 ATP-binding cassette domain-containing protein [Eisenbergiella massiliensis]MDY2651985.1 ATP-binding cassette domain-containing protein [Eisenbergiella porci]MDY5527128.1 ATP-binding cassette domain-containing protein [Eisenbergiella porci]